MIKYNHCTFCGAIVEVIRVRKICRCVDCEKIKRAKWASENTEKLNKNRKKWELKNPEKAKECRRLWAVKNPDKCRKWSLENPEKAKEYDRERRKKLDPDIEKKRHRTYREKNPDKIKEIGRVYYQKKKSTQSQIEINTAVEALMKELEMKLNLSKKTDLQLAKMLREQIQSGVTAFEKACNIIKEMFERGVTPPISITENAFKWFAQVADETLSPRFVYLFSANSNLIQAVIGSTLQQQEAWADGEEVSCAIVKADKSIEIMKKRFSGLSSAELEVVFNQGSVRSDDDQKALLEKKSKEKKILSPTKATKNISATPTGDIRIERVGTYKVEDFEQAFKDAGWKKPKRKK